MKENADGQEKKHAPDERKWKEAASRGELPKSADVGAVAVLITCAAALAAGGPVMGAAIQRTCTAVFLTIPEGPLTMERSVGLLHEALGGSLRALALPLGAALLAGGSASLMQTRLQIADEAMVPKWSKLNVFAGLKSQYLSLSPLVELGKGVGKMGILGVVLALTVWRRLDALPSLALVAPDVWLRAVVDLCSALVAGALPVLLIIATADFLWSWWKTYEGIMRTDQEVKDDRKATDGDPHVKAQRRARQRQMVLQAGLASVATADVVVTNPTHYAVALRYDRDRDHAPMVVAKGVDFLAARIREEARKSSVPRIENRPLARSLYARVKVGEPIPEELYGPVARILAVVYRRRARRRQR